MSIYFRDWLKTQVTQLVSVQACAIGPATGTLTRSTPTDLRVALWTGNIVHIYILTEPFKTRAIRNIAQRDTSQGAGTMFILAPHLVPTPGQRISPPDWMLALQALNNERLYTYPPEDREIALLQLHLEHLPTTGQFEAMYGPHVPLETLHFGRMSIKMRSIKGFWIVAHFGAEAFWQSARQARYTPPPRRQYARTNGRQTTGKPPGYNNVQRPQSRLDSYYALLGISPEASEEEVKIAFRRQVFNVHPDVSALPKMLAEEKFRALAEAYDYIKAKRGWS